MISLLGFREGGKDSSITETQILFFTRREVKLKMSPVGNTQKGCKMLQNKWKAIALKLIYRNKYAGQVSSQPVNPVTVPALELSCLIGWKSEHLRLLNSANFPICCDIRQMSKTHIKRYLPGIIASTGED